MLQLFKHGHKTGGRKPGRGHQPQAHAISLALHVAGEVQLPLNRQRLSGNGHGLRRFRVFAGRQNTQHHGPHHQRRHAFFAPDQARYVALRNMAQLVRQYRCQLIGRAHHAQQAQVHRHVAARQGKRIHAAVAAQQHGKGEVLGQRGRNFAACAGGGHQRLPGGLCIFLQLRVVDGVGVAVQLARNHVAQAALGPGAHLAAVAQRRQANRAGRLLRMDQRRSRYYKYSC